MVAYASVSNASFSAECVESIKCIFMQQRLINFTRLERHGPKELIALLVGSQWQRDSLKTYVYSVKEWRVP